MVLTIRWYTYLYAIVARVNCQRDGANTGQRKHSSRNQRKQPGQIESMHGEAPTHPRGLEELKIICANSSRRSGKLLSWFEQFSEEIEN